MSSVDAILEELHLRRRDLNNLSTSQLETIFTNLTSKEIALLCRVSSKFDKLCKDESYWKNRVLNRHGIEKKYGDTWRETARKMDEIKMINLNIEWIDGRTYKEILDDALQNGADVLQELPIYYLLSLTDNNDDDASYIRLELHDEKALQDFADTFLDRPYEQNEIDDILLINSREINVIYTAVRIYKGVRGRLPGDAANNVAQVTQSYEFLREMIDPMIYVMQFSSFPNNMLDHA